MSKTRYYKGSKASNWDFYMHPFHVLISPDYSLFDAMHAYSNPSGDSLIYNHVMNVDMTKEQLSVDIPFFILQEEENIITPVGNNEILIKLNGNMSLKAFKNAGHIPANKS